MFIVSQPCNNQTGRAGRGAVVELSGSASEICVAASLIRSRLPEGQAEWRRWTGMMGSQGVINEESGTSEPALPRLACCCELLRCRSAWISLQLIRR